MVIRLEPSRQLATKWKTKRQLLLSFFLLLNKQLRRFKLGWFRVQIVSLVQSFSASSSFLTIQSTHTKLLQNGLQTFQQIDSCFFNCELLNLYLLKLYLNNKPFELNIQLAVIFIENASAQRRRRPSTTTTESDSDVSSVPVFPPRFSHQRRYINV